MTKYSYAGITGEGQQVTGTVDADDSPFGGGCPPHHFRGCPEVVWSTFVA